MAEAQKKFPPVPAELEPLLRGIPRAQFVRLQISLPEIDVRDRHFELRKPVELLLYQDDELWVCEWCGIVSVGSAPAEAVLSFCEDFSVCWDEIAQLPHGALTKRAQSTKDSMLSVVQSVN